MAHFKTRLMERFGYAMSNEEHDELCTQFENLDPSPIFIDKNTGNTFHLVKVDGSMMILLFDFYFRCLLTVYHKGWFVKKHHGWQRTRYLKN